MSTCKCLRCGHTWWPRGNWRTQNFVPIRCAKCRSPFWNKPYVRNISHSRLNPNSSFDAKLLPSHNAGAVSMKQLEIPADKYIRVKGAKLVSPGSVRSKPSPARSKISRSVKSRAVRVAVKRGKTKQQTNQNKCKSN